MCIRKEENRMKALNNKELITFCSQLAMILRAGISAIEGIAIMREDAAKGEGGEILNALYENMEATGLLHFSMRETGVFPEYVCNMTEIGEQAGRLDEVMEGLAEHYESEEELSSGIKSALTYPMLMVGLMAVIILVLVIKVMPIFNNVFEQLGGGLTGISRSIMNLGMTMSRYGAALIAVLAVVLAAAGYLVFSKKGRDSFKNFIERSKLFGGLSEKMACARIAGGMNLCIRSGLDIDQSLEMAGQLVKHEEVKKRLDICRQKMLEGEGFDEAVIRSGLFSGVYGKMVSIGIRTGSVDQVMAKIAGQYEEEVMDKLQSSVAMIEPTLVAILSTVVGLILLSVMLPLMGVMSSIG